MDAADRRGRLSTMIPSAMTGSSSWVPGSSSVDFASHSSSLRPPKGRLV